MIYSLTTLREFYREDPDGSRPIAYVQDDLPGGAGIRVRASGVTVREGDRVNVVGIMTQTSDNGIAFKNNGEREVLASQVSVISSGNPTPPPPSWPYAAKTTRTMQKGPSVPGPFRSSLFRSSIGL